MPTRSSCDATSDGAPNRVQAFTQVIARLNRADWCVGVVLSAIAIAAVIHSRRYAGHVIDDAFVTFRQAFNLVHGEGFTCNPGERSEGTSSPLFALLMALPIALGAEPPLAAASIGTLSFVACVVLAYSTTVNIVRDRPSRLLGIGAAAIVAASPLLAFHSQTGMDTIPYCFIVALAVRLHVKTHRQPSPISWAWLSACVALTRPEGYVVFLILWVAAILRRGFASGASGAARREFVAFTLVYGPCQLFRAIYFGTWLPNAGIAPSGTSGHFLTSVFGVAARWLLNEPANTSLGTYVNDHRLALVATVGCLLLRRSRSLILLAVALACAQIAVVSCSGGDSMQHNRLLAPCLTPLAVATAVGIRGFVFHREHRTGVGHVPSYGISLAVLAIVLRNGMQPSFESAIALADPVKAREVGRRLAAVKRHDDVLVSEQAGLLPYYWQVRTLMGMAGPLDTAAARCGSVDRPNQGETDASDVPVINPTFYAFAHASNAAELFSSSAFADKRKDYYMVQYPHKYLAAYGLGAPPIIFVRKDRPDTKQVADALGVRLVDAVTELRRIGLVH
ncbi:MAG TPA: hypothetical protein VIV60_30015 [Polyangiaceae bacterium]